MTTRGGMALAAAAFVAGAVAGFAGAGDAAGRLHPVAPAEASPADAVGAALREDVAAARPRQAALRANAEGARADEAAVRVAVEHYFEGHRTGRAEEAARAFHPVARLIWIRDGALATRSLEEYLAGFDGRPAEDEAQRRRRVVNVDVAGNTAVARLELDYPDALITDFMTLLQVDGEWKIVHKSFHVQPKEESR